MKAILVIDMPTSCIGCPLVPYHFCEGRYQKVKDVVGRHKSCPLKPMPSFKAVDLNDTRDVVMFCHGWNTCLKEIDE